MIEESCPDPGVTLLKYCMEKCPTVRLESRHSHSNGAYK